MDLAYFDFAIVAAAARPTTALTNPPTRWVGLGRIIDAHTHCSGKRRDDRLRPYAELNGLRYDLEELLEEMEENGVTHALLLSPPWPEASRSLTPKW